MTGDPSGEPSSSGRAGIDLNDVLDEAPCGFLVCDPGGVILDANRTFRMWSGRPGRELTSGLRFQDLLTLPGRIFYETHCAPLLRMQGFLREISCHISRSDGPPLPVLVNSKLRLGADGRPHLIYTTVFDATERTSYEQELRLAKKHADHLAAIVKWSADAIISIGLDGTVTTWNHGAEQMLGFTEAEAMGRQIQDFVVPHEFRSGFSTLIAKLRNGKDHRHDTNCLRRDRAPLDVSVHYSPLLNGTGTVIGASVIFRDITERVRNEDHIRLLMREVNHRAKNMLSIIQVVAKQTAATLDGDEFVARFTARLHSMAKNMDLLVHNEWTGVAMRELVSGQLDILMEDHCRQIRMSGPDFRLNASAAQAIGMALHELATNACKYGALTGAEGSVAISWDLQPAEGAQRFTMEWCETGGPKAAPPQHKGFGHTVMVRMVQAALEGEVAIDYAPEGLVWKVTAPVKWVAEHPAPRRT